MSKQGVVFTHKGWFLLCPVWFANLDSAGPNIQPRHWTLDWLMYLSEFLYGLFVELGLIDPKVGFPLRITGELKPPKVIVLEVAES